MTAPRHQEPHDLQQGYLYRFDRVVTLMPELDPEDPMKALEKVRQIQPGAVALVVSVADRDGQDWYEVRFPGTDVEGWINATNLIGCGIEHMGDAMEGAVTA